MRYSQDKIHTAKLHRFSDRSGLRILATKCKSLATLEFLQTDFGGDSIIETAMIARNLKTLKISAAVELDLDQISQILRHRPTLARLEVDSVKTPRNPTSWQVDLPGLQILKLCNKASPHNPSLEFLNLPDLIQKAPSLKELRLNRFSCLLLQVIDFSSLLSLEVLELVDCTLRAAPKLPSSIRELVLLKITPQPTISHGFQFSSNLPVLEKLQLDGLTFSFPEICRLLDGIDDAEDRPSEYPKLKLLGITGTFTELWPEGLTERETLLIHPRLRNIEELIFNLNTDLMVGDDCAVLISKTFKNLRRLDLSRTWVTGVGIRAIVTALKGKLERLDVSQCRHLGQDAVEWARSHGIEVVQRAEPSISSRDSRRVLYVN